jgi:hypothetical protein
MENRPGAACVRNAAGPLPAPTRGGRGGVLLLDRHLDLGLLIAETDIAIFSLELLATGDEEPHEKQQACQQPFHVFTLHGSTVSSPPNCAENHGSTVLSTCNVPSYCSVSSTSR